MKNVFLFLITLYHTLLSPILKQLFGVSCRYSITCSEYAREMFTQYSIGEASKKTILRVLSCQPFARHYEYI